MATFNLSLLCYNNDTAQCAMGEITSVSVVSPTTLLNVHMTHDSSDIMSCNNYPNIVFVSVGIILAVIGMIVGISGFLLGLG